MADYSAMKFDKEGRLILSRRRPKKQRPEMAHYIAETGAVIWEWNSLHSGILILFYALLKPLSFGIAQTIWHSSPSDTSQRQIVLATAEIALSHNKVMLDRIRWIIRTTDKLAEYRNIAAHMAMVVDDESAPGGVSPDRVSAKSMKGLKAMLIYLERKKFWTVLAGDLFILGSYAGILGYQLSHPAERVPLPRKPRLQSLPTMKTLGEQIHHLTPRREQSPRRRASRLKPSV